MCSAQCTRASTYLVKPTTQHVQTGLRFHWRHNASLLAPCIVYVYDLKYCNMVTHYASATRQHTIALLSKGLRPRNISRKLLRKYISIHLKSKRKGRKRRLEIFIPKNGYFTNVCWPVILCTPHAHAH